MVYWKKLLLEWRKEGNDGLSIPYIIGSQQFLPETHTFQSIEDLIVDIAHNSDQEIYISYCMTINSIILGVRDDSKSKMTGSFPEHESQSQSGLFLSSFPLGLGNTVEAIAASLTDKFSDLIDAGKFSINNREWGNYHPSEVEFIKRCFNDLYYT